MPICRTCGEDKKKHARGQCAQCYWVDYQREIRRRQKQKAGDSLWHGKAIAPRSIMHMTEAQILRSWSQICKAVGL